MRLTMIEINGGEIIKKEHVADENVAALRLLQLEGLR